MKALKIVLAVLGGIIILAIIAAIIFIKTFDPNSLKDDLTAYVQERTGRTLTIDDSIELSLFPWFAVETGGVSLTDDPAFGDRNFITVDKLSARVRVWPLLKHRMEIGRVIFDGINLNLGIDSEGRGNWASLLESGTAADAEGAAAADESSVKRSIEQFAVEGIEIRNARILWHDATGELAYLIRTLDLETGTIRDDEPIDISLSLAMLDVASQASLEIELETVAEVAGESSLNDIAAAIRVLDSREQERVRADLMLDSITFSERVLRTSPLTLTAQLTRPPIGREEMQAEVRLASLQLDAQSGDLVVNGLNTRTGQLAADWNLRGSSVLSDPRIDGDVALRGNSLASLFTTLGIEQPDGIDAAARSPFSGSADFALQLKPQEMTLSNLALSVAGIEASGSASLAPDGALAGRFSVPPFSMSGPALETLQAFVPEGIDLTAVSSASANAGFSLNANRDRIDITALDVALDAAHLTGSFSLAGPEDARLAEGSVTLAGLDNRLLGAMASDLLPESLVTTELGQFRLATDFSYAFASQVAALNPMRLTAYGLSGEGQMTVRLAGDDLALSGQASLAEFSPRALLARFDQPVPESSDPTVLRSARLAASFETSGNDGRFRDIALDLDDSRITGEFSVEDFASPSYRFVLRADQIDVDRYLPPKGGSGSSNDSSSERRLGDIEIAAEPLAATVVQGSASVGNLTVGGMHYEQFSANLAVGGGRASLSSVQTRLYGGEFSGSFSVDSKGESPSVHLTGLTKNLAMQPLLTAMLGDSYLSGTGEFDLDLTGTGGTIGKAMQTAAGTMRFKLQDGAIDGVNVGRRLCTTINALKDLPAPASAPAMTAFNLIQGTATVANGITSSSDMRVSTSYLDMTGRGNMQLVDQRMSTKFIAKMTGPVNLSGCERLNARVDRSIPIGFTLDGKLPDVDVGFDVTQLLEDWAKQEIQNRADDALQNARDRLLDRIVN